MAPGLKKRDLNLDEEETDGYMFLCKRLAFKNKDKTISASSRIREFIKKDIKTLKKLLNGKDN